jgi:hypothetical protein
MHMPASKAGTTKRVARILPEAGTDESATIRANGAAVTVLERDSSAVRPGTGSATWSDRIVRPAELCALVYSKAVNPSGGKDTMKWPILRSVTAWLFIALVALFLTHPSAEPPSAFDGPLPLPAELEPLLPLP